MKKLVNVFLLCGIIISGCTTSDSRVAGYTTGGAAVGALAGGAMANNTGKGALAGAAVGGVLGALTATAMNNDQNYYNSHYYSNQNVYNPYPTNTNNLCMYRDSYGRQYTARCN